MKPIISIEGVSFAGKTTITKLLEEDGYFRLYELADKFNHGGDFPPFAKNTEEANYSDDWFLEQEIIREQDAINMSENVLVFADRSFLSGLAYSYARYHVFGIGDPERCKRNIIKSLKNEKIHLPWLVYLKANIDTIKIRQEFDLSVRMKEFGEKVVANVTVPKNELRFFIKLMEFYDNLFSVVPHLMVDATKNPSEIIDLIKKHSKSINSQFNKDFEMT